MPLAAIAVKKRSVSGPTVAIWNGTIASRVSEPHSIRLTTGLHGEVVAERPVGCPGLQRGSIMDPSGIWDPYSNQPSPDFGCATETNFAKQIAYPESLVVPTQIGQGEGNAQVGAVERYQADKVKVFTDDAAEFIRNDD